MQRGSEWTLSEGPIRSPVSDLHSELLESKMQDYRGEEPKYTSIVEMAMLENVLRLWANEPPGDEPRETPAGSSATPTPSRTVGSGVRPGAQQKRKRRRAEHFHPFPPSKLIKKRHFISSSVQRGWGKKKLKIFS